MTYQFIKAGHQNSLEYVVLVANVIEFNTFSEEVLLPFDVELLAAFKNKAMSIVVELFSIKQSFERDKNRTQKHSFWFLKKERALIVP